MFQEGGAAQPGIHSHVQDAEGPWSGMFVELNFDAEGFFSSTTNLHHHWTRCGTAGTQGRELWSEGRASWSWIVSQEMAL